MKPQLYIFDLDGTLIEFHHEYLLGETVRILEELKHAPVERAILEDAFSAFDFFRFFDEKRRDELTEAFWSHFDWERFPRARVIPGVLEQLEQLSKGGKIAIATSRFCPPEEVERDLEGTGILEFVSHIETRTCDHIHWSDKKGHLENVCKHFNVAPDRAAMFGDVPPDVSSAHAVGIEHTYAVLSGGIRKDVLEKVNPKEILVDLSHLRL